ncbi:MAG TPA: MFS transporter [Polyangia bacterium]|nr:MFS transporter [Polyangia bacterium]
MRARLAGSRGYVTLGGKGGVFLSSLLSPRRFGLSALRHRDFALLFSGTIVSHSGDLLQSMAQSWLVFQLTGSAAKLGLTGFCQLIPRLVLGAVGGVFVDRFDRRRLLLVTQTAAMLQSILFWALVVTHRITFGEILALTVVLGVADTLNLTARHALIPALVPPGELQAGVALNSAGMNLTQVIGPSLGGVLLGLVGVSGCLALNAVSFLGILGALFAMHWRPRAGDRIRRPVRDELAEGIGYVRRREALWVPILIAYGVAALAMAYTRLLPVFATDVLHAGVREYGWLLAAPGVGALAASLAVAARGRRPGARRRLYLAVATLVVGLCVFATSAVIWLSLAALAVVGAAQMVFRTTAVASIHEAVEDSHRGRVISIFLLDYGLWSFGTLWLGILCDTHGPAFAVLTGALSCLVVTAGIAVVARVRRAGAVLSAR